MNFSYTLGNEISQKFKDEDLGFVIHLLHDKFKYQVLWHLRHLEKALNAENGEIRVNPENKDMPFEVIDFSLSLKILIEDALDSLDLSIDVEDD